MKRETDIEEMDRQVVQVLGAAIAAVAPNPKEWPKAPGQGCENWRAMPDVSHDVVSTLLCSLLVALPKAGVDVVTFAERMKSGVAGLRKKGDDVLWLHATAFAGELITEMMKAAREAAATSKEGAN